MIAPAFKSDITKILTITKACATHMIAQGIFQWNEHYPSRQAFEKDVAREELFVYRVQNKIVGCIVISSLMDAEYIPVSWNAPTNTNLYIHRLAVHPSHQKSGIARALMDYAYAFAKATQATSIRLDTYSQNPRNQGFYEARGYQKVGQIYFPKQSEHPFYCYERYPL